MKLQQPNTSSGSQEDQEFPINYTLINTQGSKRSQPGQKNLQETIVVPGKDPSVIELPRLDWRMDK